MCFRNRAPTPHFITPPEVANTNPGVNRGSEGGARGCGFEGRVGVHARTGGIQFAGYFVCVSVCHKTAVYSGRVNKLSYI